MTDETQTTHPADPVVQVRCYESDKNKILEIARAWSAQTNQAYTSKDVVAEMIEQYAGDLK